MTGRYQCGRSKAPFPGHREQLFLVELVLSERLTSCVGSGCKLADAQGRKDFQGNVQLWCHSMPLSFFVLHVFVYFP